MGNEEVEVLLVNVLVLLLSASMMWGHMRPKTCARKLLVLVSLTKLLTDDVGVTGEQVEVLLVNALVVLLSASMMWGHMRPKTCARKLLVHGTDDVVLPLVGKELVQLIDVKELKKRQCRRKGKQRN